jgi:hypothetical protein
MNDSALAALHRRRTGVLHRRSGGVDRGSIVVLATRRERVRGGA